MCNNPCLKNNDVFFLGLLPRKIHILENKYSTDHNELFRNGLNMYIDQVNNGEDDGNLQNDKELILHVIDKLKTVKLLKTAHSIEDDFL